MKIIIASPSYTMKWGGIVVLHKLSHILNEIGYNSYMIGENPNYGECRLNPKFNTKTIHSSEIDINKDIIVYPEVVSGNPYGIRNVVRYILYYNSVRKNYTSWGNDDFWIYYRDDFYDGMRDYNILQIIDSKLNYFKNLGLERDIESCFLIKKFIDYKQEYIQFHPDNSLEINGYTDEYYLETFNRCKRFYSYDNDTYISVIAALCGCDSIIIPRNGISKDQWVARNKERKYGIAYGLDDLENCKNVDKLIDTYKNIDITQNISTDIMFKKIIQNISDK